MYHCDDLSGVDLTQDGPCNTVSSKIRQCRVQLLSAWAIGGNVSEAIISYEAIYV